jgi:hypothetical protein
MDRNWNAEIQKSIEIHGNPKSIHVFSEVTEKGPINRNPDDRFI